MEPEPADDGHDNGAATLGPVCVLWVQALFRGVLAGGRAGREGCYGSGGGACADVRWDQSAALHHSALAAARQAGDRLGEADAFRELGALQRETGSYPAAAATLARALALYRDVGDQPGQASALNELASCAC